LTEPRVGDTHRTNPKPALALPSRALPAATGDTPPAPGEVRLVEIAPPAGDPLTANERIALRNKRGKS